MTCRSGPRSATFDQFGGRTRERPLEPGRITAPERRFLDAEAIADLIVVPDLSLAGSARDLELATVDWPQEMRRGYLGIRQQWER